MDAAKLAAPYSQIANEMPNSKALSNSVGSSVAHIISTFS